MATVAELFNQLPANSHGGLTEAEASTLDWETDSVVCLLLKDTWTPDRDNDAFISDIVAHEATDVTNYSRATVTGKNITYTAATRVNMYDCDDPSFTNLTGTFKYAVFAKNTGSDATSALICFIDLDDTDAAPPVPSGETFTLEVPVTGLFTATPQV